jgi:serine/threonine protein kinase
LREKQIESDTPEPISQLIISCLEKDPSKRPASIRAIAHAVDPVAATQPLFITPPPATARPTGRKTAPSPRRRFSAEFYIVMTLMAALLVIAAVTLWIVLRK